MSKTHQIELEIDGVGVMATVHYTAKRLKAYKAQRANGAQLEPDEPAGWMIEIESIVIDGSEIDLLPYLRGSEGWMAYLLSDLHDIENNKEDDAE